MHRQGTGADLDMEISRTIDLWLLTCDCGS
jgi:hypothetical protein